MRTGSCQDQLSVTDAAMAMRQRGILSFAVDHSIRATVKEQIGVSAVWERKQMVAQ